MEKIRSEITEETETFTSRIKEGYTFTSIIESFMIHAFATGALVAGVTKEIDTTSVIGTTTYTNVLLMLTDGDNNYMPNILRQKVSGVSDKLEVQIGESLPSGLTLNAIFFNN